MPNRTLPLALVATCLSSLCLTTSIRARADLPQVTVAAMIGRPIDDEGPGLGVGIRGGVKLAGAAAPYFGARAVRYSDVTPSVVASSASMYDLGVEAGYEWTFGPLAVRPQLGLGMQRLSLTGTDGAVLAATHAFLSPGVIVACEIGHPLFVGLDVDYTKLFSDITDTHFLSVYLEAGAKF